MRTRRVNELVKAVSTRLDALGVGPEAAAYDGWLASDVLRDAVAQASTGESLLLRAAEVGFATAAEPGAGPVPAEPLWLLWTKGSSTVRACSMRHEEAPRAWQLSGVELTLEPLLCCDAKKCSHHKVLARLVLQHDAGEALLAEAVAHDEEAARTELQPLATALQEALVAESAAPGQGIASKQVGSKQVGSKQAAASKPGAQSETALRASALSRWALRAEDDMMVLRDYASQGPREASGREHAILALLLLGAAAGLYGAWVSYVQQSYEQLAISAAIGVVLAVGAFAAWRIARHSAAYRADSEPLLFLHRDRLVIAPWLLRNGAVRAQPDGRYGAALPLREVNGLAVEQQGDGWLIACDTEHGPFHIGSALDEAGARAWCARLRQLIRAFKHQPSPGKARRHSAALSAAVVALLPGPMLLGTTLLVGTALLGTIGCDPPPPRPQPHPTATPTAATTPSAPATAVASTPATSSAAPVPPAPQPKLKLIEDDIPGAMAKAKASDKPLLVEVWAPWCHTCLSMKSFVLPDPTIVALQDKVLFAAVDSDKPVNEAFMDRYAVNTWPTLFMIDPGGEVLSLWQGAASVNELRAFIQDALDIRGAKHTPQGPLSALLAGRRAHAKGKYAQAAIAYQKALRLGGDSWPRRGEATVGLIRSQYRLGAWGKCAQLGRDNIASIEGAALPTDVSWVLLSCAKRLGDKAAARQLVSLVAKRMARHVAEPPAGSSVDDRVDALAMHANLLRRKGDIAGVRKATEKQLQLLEKAAAAAPSPETAATFDYARMNAYLSLGRGNEAVALFRKRMQQLPDAYEPPGRLAQTLMALKRYQEAKPVIKQAIDKAYGPRRLRYLKMHADILRALKDRPGETKALQVLVKAYEELGEKQRNHPRHRAGLRAAKQRLAGLGSPR